jgi:hypothetical protein
MHAICADSLYFLYLILVHIWRIRIVLRIELIKCVIIAKLKITSEVVNFDDRIFIFLVYDSGCIM